MSDPLTTLYYAAFAAGVWLMLGLLYLWDRYRDHFSAWHIFECADIVLGIHYDRTPGCPPGDEDFPEGFPHYHNLFLGIGLVTVRVWWMGKVPKSRPAEAAPGGSGNEPPNPLAHGEEGTEEGRPQETGGPESSST